MEVEREGKSRQRHTRFVVRRKIYDLRWAGARAFHCHLRRFKLNLMGLGFADDGVTEFLICIEREQPDSGAALCRKVHEFPMELKVGQFARSNLPARDDA